MLTATMSPVTTCCREIPEPIEAPPRLTSKLHDVLWYVEIALQRTGFAPSVDEICHGFGVSRVTAAEMIRLLRDKGLVYLFRDGQLRVGGLTVTGQRYCFAYAPA